MSIHRHSRSNRGDNMTTATAKPLSRSTRRQLIALDLIEGAVDAVSAANPSNTKIDQIVRRVRRTQHALRSQLITLGDQGQMVFPTPKEHKRYKRELHQVHDTISAQWPGEELDGREYVNTLLVYCDRMKVGRTAQEWEAMEGLLQELYMEMDPALSADEQMDAGEQAGETLREVMEG